MNRYRRARLRAAFLYWCVIPAVVVGGGLVIDLVFSLRRWAPHRLWAAAAIFFLALGTLFIHLAERDLVRFGGGTPSPFRPARFLVTGGIYGLCRHPMFFGYDLAALGVLCILRSPSALAIAFPSLLLWQVFFLAREERILALRFGREFDAYRRRVSFLVPCPWRRNP